MTLRKVMMKFDQVVHSFLLVVRHSIFSSVAAWNLCVPNFDIRCIYMPFQLCVYCVYNWNCNSANYSQFSLRNFSRSHAQGLKRKKCAPLLAYPIRNECHAINYNCCSICYLAQEISYHLNTLLC